MTPVQTTSLPFIVPWSIKPYLHLVQADLEKVEAMILSQVDHFDPDLRGYMSYAFNNHGKAIRPGLSLLAAKSLGPLQNHHYLLATIIELLHLASLIHDDIIDQASLRRGQATLHSKWGAHTALLLGDCLFARALELCTQLPTAEVVRKIAQAAHEVCAGEILQNQRKLDFNLSTSDYVRIIKMKTGAFFRISTELSGMLHQAPAEQIEALRSYGENLGIAYQIYDDWLDLFSSQEVTGKTAGTDLTEGKLTLPILYVLQQLQGNARAEFCEKIIGYRSSEYPTILATLNHHNASVSTLQTVQHYLEMAQKNLSSLASTTTSIALNPALKLLHEIPAAFTQHLESVV